MGRSSALSLARGKRVKMQPRTFVVLVAAVAGLIAQIVALELAVPRWVRLVIIPVVVGVAVWVAGSASDRRRSS
jgi:hypothetical protein